MRWMPESQKTETLLQETAKNIRSQRQMLKDHNVILALETHFEFTTWELLRLFEMCETEPGDFLGVCLDTMNLLTMLEEPVLAAERILPWVVCTHIKDGAIIIDPKGLVTFPTEIGKGVVNLREITERLASLEHEIHLSVEGHGGSFSLPIFDSLFLSKFPDLTLHEFVSLIQMARKGEKDLRDGKIAIVEREKWPEICEPRLRKDIKSLRKLLEI
jgi:sugar phosphate isomerase/epimerase